MKGEIKPPGEKAPEYALFLASTVSFAICGAIFAYLLINSVPALRHSGIFGFVAGARWSPAENRFGALPMLAGSFLVCALAAVLALPCGLCCALFLRRYCGERVRRLTAAAVGVLAATPSIVYGLFGLSILSPLLEGLKINGSSALCAAVLLAMMVLPTFISMSLEALNATPEHIYEAARALGCTREHSAVFAELRAAKNSVLAAITLCMGRVLGETTAVIMVAGNQARMPGSIFDGVRTLTGNILLEMGYATGLHRSALIATALLLSLLTLGISLAFSSRGDHSYS